MNVILLEPIYGIGVGLEWVPDEDAFILDLLILRIVWLRNVGD